MPNDAKLGLLVGVLGVIIASLVTVQRPPLGPPRASAAPPSAAAKSLAKPAPMPTPAASVDPAGSRAPAELPVDLTSTPVVRTKRDTDATPAARTPTRDDDLDP